MTRCPDCEERPAYAPCPRHPPKDCRAVIERIRRDVPEAPPAERWNLDAGAWRCGSLYGLCPLGMLKDAPKDAPTLEDFEAECFEGLTARQLGDFIEWWDGLPFGRVDLEEALAAVWHEPLP